MNLIKQKIVNNHIFRQEFNALLDKFHSTVSRTGMKWAFAFHSKEKENNSVGFHLYPRINWNGFVSYPKYMLRFGKPKLEFMKNPVWEEAFKSSEVAEYVKRKQKASKELNGDIKEFCDKWEIPYLTLNNYMLNSMRDFKHKHLYHYSIPYKISMFIQKINGVEV